MVDASGAYWPAFIFFGRTSLKVSCGGRRTGLRFERLVLTYQFEGPRRAQAVSRWWMYTDTQRAIDANRVELLYSRAMGSKFETQAVTTHI